MAAILVLEDDDDLRETIGDVFEEAGTIKAATMREMQSQAAGVLQCRVAVLDVNLGPGEPGGLEAAAWLRNQGFKGRIIFLTGHAASYPDLVDRSRELGAQVVEKPTQFTRLEEIVNESLQ
jgi:DNA-binding response OmpR family regulator